MSITLFSLSNVYHDLVEFSLKKTLSTLKFDDVVIACDKRINLGIDYTLLDMAPFRVDEYFPREYSKFMMKELNSHFHTDFILITQFDGMACNPSFWDDEYYEYDYIGAPINWLMFEFINARKIAQVDNERFNNKKWCVGNGGFCLRSKKLQQILQEDDNIKFYVRDDNRLWIGEDSNICVVHRGYLEKKHNIKFAPLDLALKFSTENFMNQGLSYGFHGIHNIPMFLTEEECIFYMKKLLRLKRGYRVVNYGLLLAYARMKNYGQLIQFVLEKTKGMK